MNKNIDKNNLKDKPSEGLPMRMTGFYRGTKPRA